MTKQNSEETNKLLVEYTECFSNYIYRDKLVAHEFYLTVTIVGIVFAVLNSLGETLTFAGLSIILVVGFFALNILHIDIMRNSSSKHAAIQRAKDIELLMRSSNAFSDSDTQLAHKIFLRPQLALESFFQPISTSYLMILFIRLMIVVWIFLGMWMIQK